MRPSFAGDAASRRLGLRKRQGPGRPVERHSEGNHCVIEGGLPGDTAGSLKAGRSPENPASPARGSNPAGQVFRGIDG
jgi:hypothetical protein